MINRKSFLVSLFPALFLVSNLLAQTEPPQLTLPTTSPPSTVKQRIGVTDIEITYNRPSMKGRQIFGGLVPNGQVWRTGANAATTVSFSTAVKVGGAEVPAGTYELFTIPSPTEWTVIIHQKQSQWGSYAYDSANDVARVSVVPVSLAETVESFSIGIGDLTSNTGTLDIAWDNVRVSVPIEIDVVGQLVPQIEAAMKAEGQKPYFAAAMFYFENDLDINKAAEWMAAAVEERPGRLGMLYRQGLILAKKGDKAGAISAARKSLEVAAKAGQELREEYIRLNTALIQQLEE